MSTNPLPELMRELVAIESASYVHEYCSHSKLSGVVASSHSVALKEN